eukprot:EG_transcript_16072
MPRGGPPLRLNRQLAQHLPADIFGQFPRLSVTFWTLLEAALIFFLFTGVTYFSPSTTTITDLHRGETHFPTMFLCIFLIISRMHIFGHFSTFVCIFSIFSGIFLHFF